MGAGSNLEPGLSSSHARTQWVSSHAGFQNPVWDSYLAAETWVCSMAQMLCAYGPSIGFSQDRADGFQGNLGHGA